MERKWVCCFPEHLSAAGVLLQAEDQELAPSVLGWAVKPSPAHLPLTPAADPGAARPQLSL